MTDAEIAKRFQPFVTKTAARFTQPGVEYDDLVQTGMMALVVSARLWRPGRGANLLTWVHRPVRNAMSRLVMAARRRGMGTRAGGRHTEGRGRNYAPVQLSFDAPMEDSGGEDTKLHEIIPSPEDEGLDVFELAHLLRAVGVLTPRERRVIDGRYGRGLTLREVGEEMGVTRERIRQIEVDALEKMRPRLRALEEERKSA